LAAKELNLMLMTTYFKMFVIPAQAGIYWYRHDIPL